MEAFGLGLIVSILIYLAIRNWLRVDHYSLSLCLRRFKNWLANEFQAKQWLEFRLRASVTFTHSVVCEKLIRCWNCVLTFIYGWGRAHMPTIEPRPKECLRNYALQFTLPMDGFDRICVLGPSHIRTPTTANHTTFSSFSISTHFVFNKLLGAYQFFTWIHIRFQLNEPGRR